MENNMLIEKLADFLINLYFKVRLLLSGKPATAVNLNVKVRKSPSFERKYQSPLICAITQWRVSKNPSPLFIAQELKKLENYTEEEIEKDLASCYDSSDEPDERKHFALNDTIVNYMAGIRILEGTEGKDDAPEVDKSKIANLVNLRDKYPCGGFDPASIPADVKAAWTKAAFETRKRLLGY